MTTTIRPKRTTIKLRTNEGITWQVPAVVYGAFAVHTPGGSDYATWRQTAYFVVSHVATGRRMATCAGRITAGRIARALNIALTDGDLTEADQDSERYKKFAAKATTIIRDYLGARWRPWE